MAEIIPFRPRAEKKPTQDQVLNQNLSSKGAIDLVVLGFLECAMPRWVAREWPFRQLELMCNELRSALEESIPDQVSRFQVEAMVNQLRPSWQVLVEEIEPEIFW